MEKIDGLLPCPFCGGRAELDTQRGYRSMSGSLGNAVAIYCLKCEADMSICREDVPDLDPSQLAEDLTEKWNTREQDERLRAEVVRLEGRLAVWETRYKAPLTTG